ncbi:MAG: insulinase family protein [Alphaproteobacteria bacterium]|nr:insulinase family protein [Alphaproteobacteria bacterium]MCB9793416.1 insulinase family protein [Alphaproteobacteria bacterium]
MIPLLLTLACAPKVSPETEVPQTVDPLAQRPEVPAAKPFSPALPETFTLGPELKVTLLERSELPLVSVRVIVPGGSAWDPKGADGLVVLSDSLLTRGAGERDALAFAEAVEREGFTLHVGTHTDYSVVTLDAHADRLDAGLALLADALFRPRFDADEVERGREQLIGRITQSLDEPASVAARVGDQLYYKNNPAWGHPSSGTVDSVKGLDAEALRESWSQRYNGHNAELVVVGAVDRDTLSAALEQHLAPWIEGVEPMGGLGVRSTPEYGAGFYLVDNPGATQSVLRVMIPSVSASSEQALPTRLGMVVLGGTFTSRLNRLLREEKGYTYGARASLQDYDSHGRVLAYSAVRGDVTAEALVDMLGEVERITQGIDEAELDKAKGSRRTDLVAAMETRAGTANTLVGLSTDGLAMDGVATELRAIDAVQLEAVNESLRALDPSRALVLVVGDLATIREPLEAAIPGPWIVVDKL